MESTEVTDKNGGVVTVPVTDWFLVGAHAPVRDGYYEFVFEGGPDITSHLRLFANGYWHHMHRPGTRAHVVAGDRWRGIKKDA